MRSVASGMPRSVTIRQRFDKHLTKSGIRGYLSTACQMFVDLLAQRSTMSTTTARHSAARLNLPRSALGSLAAAGAVTLALAGTASAADSSNTVALKKAGDTRLTLGKKAGGALKGLGIKIAPASGSKIAAGAVVFPITS